MPEFILDTSGKAYRSVSATSMEAVRWPDLDAFTRGYIEALFFTETDIGGTPESFDPENGSALPCDATFADLAPETLAEIMKDCAAFHEAHWELLEAAEARGRPMSHLGHDFWLTRNGHGAGFWCRPELAGGGLGDRLAATCGWRTPFPEVDVYLGDDGRVYA